MPHVLHDYSFAREFEKTRALSLLAVFFTIAVVSLIISESGLFAVFVKLFNNDTYYPTSLCRVQITPKTSTNITRYLYSRGPVRQVFSQRVSGEFDSSYENKFCLSIGISFLRFFLTEISK